MLLQVELAACVGRLKGMGLLRISKQGFPLFAQYALEGDRHLFGEMLLFPSPSSSSCCFYSPQMCFEAVT